MDKESLLKKIILNLEDRKKLVKRAYREYGAGFIEIEKVSYYEGYADGVENVYNLITNFLDENKVKKDF